MPPRDRHWSNCTKPIAPNSSHIFTWNEERRQIWASNPIWSTALDILTRKYHGYKDLLSAGWSLVTDPQLWIRCWVLLQAALVGLTYADDDRRCNFARCIKCAFATQAPEVSWLATWIIRWMLTMWDVPICSLTVKSSKFKFLLEPFSNSCAPEVSWLATWIICWMVFPHMP